MSSKAEEIVVDTGLMDGKSGIEAPQAPPLKVIRFATLQEAEAAEKVAIANELAGLAYGIERGSFAERIRSERRLTEARQLAMYLANVSFGLRFEVIAQAMERDRATVRYGIEKVEDRRENPQFDMLLVALETLIGCLLDKEVSEAIEYGLHIDHDLIAFVPNTED